MEPSTHWPTKWTHSLLCHSLYSSWKWPHGQHDFKHYWNHHSKLATLLSVQLYCCCLYHCYWTSKYRVDLHTSRSWWVNYVHPLASQFSRLLSGTYNEASKIIQWRRNHSSRYAKPLHFFRPRIHEYLKLALFPENEPNLKQPLRCISLTLILTQSNQNLGCEMGWYEATNARFHRDYYTGDDSWAVSWEQWWSQYVQSYSFTNILLNGCKGLKASTFGKIGSLNVHTLKKIAAAHSAA